MLLPVGHVQKNERTIYYNIATFLTAHPQGQHKHIDVTADDRTDNIPATSFPKSFPRHSCLRGHEGKDGNDDRTTYNRHLTDYFTT